MASKADQHSRKQHKKGREREKGRERGRKGRREGRRKETIISRFSLSQCRFVYFLPSIIIMDNQINKPENTTRYEISC